MNYDVGYVLIAAFLIISIILIDKLFNKFRITTFFINIWIGIFKLMKQMGDWRGLISLLISWLLLSGSGLIVLGIILKVKTLTTIGIAMYAFWLGPFTPLIPIMIGFALLLQRIVFRDKNVKKDRIIALFKEAFKKEEYDDKE